MKSVLLTVTTLTLMLGAGQAYADDDCHDPIADWQPREMLRQMLNEKDWQVKRIKVDDGCYEVKGRDNRGNRIKAKYAPASLRIRSLDVEFANNGDTTGYPDLPTNPSLTTDSSLNNSPTEARDYSETDPKDKGKKHHKHGE